jgi:hypothetical protein
MCEIEKRLRARGIEFDALDRKVMCFPHVVNLSSGRVIEGLTKVLEEYPEDWEPPALISTKQSYADAVARDPIALGRAVVRAIRASGSRREAFDDVIKTGNAKNWFKDGGETIQVKPLQLLRDVSTRWDSVYYMINRLREMRPVSQFSHVQVCFIANRWTRIGCGPLPRSPKQQRSCQVQDHSARMGCNARF